MAKDKKAEKSRNGAVKKKNGFFFRVFFPLGFLFLLFFKLPLVVLVFCGMVPTLVAYLSDARQEKYLTICVACFNFVGVSVFLVDFFARPMELKVALGILSGPKTWVIIFSAAAFGWIIFFLLPFMIRGFLKVHYEGQIRGYRNKLEKLSKMWSEDLSNEM